MTADDTLAFPLETDGPAVRLLEALGRATPHFEPPRTRRIFVNRTVKMDHIEVIGFDMDYTLALYNQPKMEALSAQCTLEKLVKRGYPPAILSFPYDSLRAIRGLVIDRPLGNILKMDRHGYVGRAYHGTRQLSREERFGLYREQQIRLADSRYAWIDTLFALPEAVLFGQLVDFFDRDPTFTGASADVRAARYDQLWVDIRESIDEAHRDGSIKTAIKAQLPEYIAEDGDLASTLQRFRSAGKRLFIVTNSGYDYTETVMSYLLDNRIENFPSWRNYFDVVVVDAQKPHFFAEERPLYALDERGALLGPVGESERAKPGALRLYQGGCVRVLAKLLELRGDRVLYVGDHIYGDMLRAKRSSVWRTAMIVQELEQELIQQAKIEEEVHTLEALERRCNRIDAELRYQQLLSRRLSRMRAGDVLPAPEAPADATASDTPLVVDATMIAAARASMRRRIQTLKKAHGEAMAEIDRVERSIDHTFNPYFGPLLKEGAENSRLGEQVEDYACLYTSRVSNFLYYSPFQYFRSPRDHLPHERVY